MARDQSALKLMALHVIQMKSGKVLAAGRSSLEGQIAALETERA